MAHALPTRVAAASILVAAVVTAAAWRATTRALGDVVAITPDHVAFAQTGAPFGFWLSDVELSGRGEVGVVVGQFDEIVNGLASPQFDRGERGIVGFGRGMGVSGDGCVAVVLEDGDFQTDVRVVNRCLGTDEVITSLSGEVRGSAAVAVTHDGAFAAAGYDTITYGTAAVGVPGTSTVAWVDLTNGRTIYLEGGELLTPAMFGLGIDDSGRSVVLPIGYAGVAQVNVWEVGSGELDGEVVDWGRLVPLTEGSDDQWSAFPSISGDGRWISFASNIPRGVGEDGPGPWVFVVPRDGSGPGTLVSPPDQPSYFSSLSGDGSQVAYSVGINPEPGSPCAPVSEKLFSTCPPARVEVASGPEPGLAGGFRTAAVSLDANGEQVGVHAAPDLSGNGRWVAWLTDAAGLQSLTGQSIESGPFAVMRRRDALLTVDRLDLPPTPQGTPVTGSATVLNSGDTSVWLDELVTDSAEFVISGGSCAVGRSLAPGAACTVDVTFAASVAGSAAGSLRVGEAATAYDRVAAVSDLSGAATPPSTTTSTSTTTTSSSTTSTTTTSSSTTSTTAATVPTPSPTPDTAMPNIPTPSPPISVFPPQVTTSTTVPAGSPALRVSPTSIDFGQVAVGFESDPQTVEVTNDGTVGGPIQASITGADAADFSVRTNGCSARPLAVSATCRVEVVLLPRAGGVRTATLTVRSGSASGTVTLTGAGVFDPKLFPSPSAITERGISLVYGVGFPPGDTFTVEVVETGFTFQGTADERGVFRAPLGAVMAELLVGGYTLRVTGVPDTFDDVEAPFAVVLATFRPQGAAGPAFGSPLVAARGN